MSDKFEQGMQVRRAVLGDAHVDRAEANKTDFDADFQQFITETAWGSVWARPGLERKTRHLLTIGLLAVLGKEAELAMHVRATRNTGVTPDEVKEVLLQVAAASHKLEGLDPVETLVDVLAHSGDDALLPQIVWQNLHPLLGRDTDRVLAGLGTSQSSAAAPVLRRCSRNCFQKKPF